MTQYPYVVVATPRDWRSGPSFVSSRHRTIDAAIDTARRQRSTTRSDYRLITGRVDRPYRVGEDIVVADLDLSPTEVIRHGSFGPIVWDTATGETRLATQKDMDTLEVGPDLSPEEEAEIPEE